MRLVVMSRFAVAGVLALGGVAAAQTATPSVSIDWNALHPPPASGTSVNWGAIGAPPPSRIASGMSVDWSAIDALPPAQPGASSAPLLRPPPPEVALVPPPKPVAPPPAAVAPPAAAPKKPVAPVVAAVSPPPAVAPPAAPVVPAAAPASLPGKTEMVRFAKGQKDLPADGHATLDALAAQFAGNPKLRLQIVAYASGSGDDPVEARRLSLTRAVALRNYLIEKGVQSVRMDVRALGNRGAGEGPADRVDLVIAEH